MDAADPGFTPEALDPSKAPPSDRFCDLILTGGVTSGVVYPWAILELARAYRLKRIGGTSVGAMAAALAAAAEYSRREGRGAGFEVLRVLPEALAADEGRGTKLLSLFQPSSRTKRLFAVFLDMLNRSETSGRFAWAARLAAAIAQAYAAVWVVVLAAGAAAFWLSSVAIKGPGFWFAALAALLTTVLVAMLAVVGAIYRDVVQGLTRNGFGICTGGYTKTPSKSQPLIAWLNEGLQKTVGRPNDRDPLTFADLAGPAGPDQALRSIHLQTVTTNLSHGRPYTLPLNDDTSRLFFRGADLLPYFPKYVVDHMIDKAIPYAPRSSGDPLSAGSDGPYFELPGDDLPVLVAARLSLSFPFLFSAVPLWAIDYEARVGERTLQRCWFSDGGICSNFPIHFFDTLIPRWPTFGISLGPRSPHWEDEAVWLPTYHYEGRGDAWNRIAEPSSSRAAWLGSFVSAMVDSAKNWNDNTLMRMPAVRDRVVRVGLGPGEGNLNLKLTQAQILSLARNYGTLAGRRLVDKFRPQSAASETAVAWDEHRWVRFNLLLSALDECLDELEARAERAPYAKKITELIDGAFIKRPLRGERPQENALSASQADALDKLREAVNELGASFQHQNVRQPYRGEPRPSLRIRSRY